MAGSFLLVARVFEYNILLNQFPSQVGYLHASDLPKKAYEPTQNIMRTFMTREHIYQATIIFVVFVLAASAIGYMFFPSAMLSVVGITSNNQMDFLVRTLAAALVALIPSTWSARKRGNSSLFQSVVFGIAIYMFLSSIVDLHAYLTQIINSASIPSIVFRVALGGALVWLMPRK